MPSEKSISLQIAVPIPVRHYFDYLPPQSMSWQHLQPGMRVKIPFGKGERVGFFIGFNDQAAFPQHKLKRVMEVIDAGPLIPDGLFKLCLWAAEYYHHPLGEILANALPVLLRQGRPFTQYKEDYWYLTQLAEGIDLTQLNRAPRQKELFNLLQLYPEGLTIKQISDHRIPSSIIRALCHKGWIASRSELLPHTETIAKPPLPLNPQQQKAVAAIYEARDRFQVFLLDGVTGSGKTEVYLQVIQQILNLNKQILVLIPEIGLTPQTLKRFRERFSVPVLAQHSGLTEKARLNVWSMAKLGKPLIIIGTRSSVFSPLENLGLIIIDEEHDLSFKQQEGFRYHARDIAIMRANLRQIPVVLGSATPALETLYNTKKGKFKHIRLLQRAGNASLPEFEVIDIRNKHLEEGFSEDLLNEIKKTLQRGDQVMIFLNRRGFAPVLLCAQCGWMADCKRCDMRMTYHLHSNNLHCHHCNIQKKIPNQCEVCGQLALTPVGLGTQRLEQVLKKHFPNDAIARLDRDNTFCKGAIERLLNGILEGHYPLLIGTQMLAKGHHFPNVTLVAIIDADAGFFSGDFRGLERMGQLLLQVAGRAGRVEKKGRVLVQTYHPEHPLLNQLFQKGYARYADTLLDERKIAHLPPYTFFALFRAEAHKLEDAEAFLESIKKNSPNESAIKWLGPMQAPIARKAGFYRAQLILHTSFRLKRQQFLNRLLNNIEKISDKKRVRWSLDIDPLEMF